MKDTKLLTGLAVILAAILGACNTNVEPEESEFAYFLGGGLVKNLDNNTITIAAHFMRNDTVLESGTIVLKKEGSPVDTIFFYTGYSAYIITYDSSSSLAAGQYTLKLSDTLDFEDSITFVIPDDFEIDTVSLPEDRVNPAGAAVQLVWQISLDSDGYVLAVSHKDSTYGGAGHSEFVTSGATAETIPPDAFRLSGDLDTGWYYVYVYSYTGSPFTDRNLPVPFPEGLTENIEKLNLTGAFGAAIVTTRDSIHVTIQE